LTSFHFNFAGCQTRLQPHSDIASFSGLEDHRRQQL
jgi:hypothetical protein